MSERLLEVETISPSGLKDQRMYIPYVTSVIPVLAHMSDVEPRRYDKLIIAVGSTASTHGVPGLEHCFQLKTVSDAQAIRKRIIGVCDATLSQCATDAYSPPDNFEAASLPTTTPEERKRLLSFVVCGGGPTGVETAAEIYDLCQEDLMNYVSTRCHAKFARSMTPGA